MHEGYKNIHSLSCNDFNIYWAIIIKDNQLIKAVHKYYSTLPYSTIMALKIKKFIKFKFSTIYNGCENFKKEKIGPGKSSEELFEQPRIIKIKEQNAHLRRVLANCTTCSE